MTVSASSSFVLTQGRRSYTWRMSSNDSPAPKAPAGWYDHESLLGIKRYWDGSAWTERTVPAAEVPQQRASRVPYVVAAVAVVVAIAAIVFALTRPVVTEIVEVTPSASPSASAVTVPPGDYSAFVKSATRDLDDFDKDLDDVETTIDQDGYWRLLSNTAELRFNLEQLRGTAAPGFLAAEWDDSLDDLDDALQDLAASIDKKQSAQREALERSREASEAARGLVELLER